MGDEFHNGDRSAFIIMNWGDFKVYCYLNNIEVLIAVLVNYESSVEYAKNWVSGRV
tara:strand:+ start:377 stop:544 length:168 start_codon:yes stop_codon:yes gene_type:complete